MVLHSLVSSLVVGHSFPPSFGMVAIVLVFVWNPEPHDLLQVPQSLQSVISQSTIRTKVEGGGLGLFSSFLY